MTVSPPETAKSHIRPAQYRDLDLIATLAGKESDENADRSLLTFANQVRQMRRWFGLYKLLSLFPNPFQYHFCIYIAELAQTNEQPPTLEGSIQVSPFNSSRSTWRVEQVRVARQESLADPKGVGSQLLRHCLETVWEARTWILEVNIHHKDSLALYRQHGFQPLAELTYWFLSPELLQELAQNEPDLPNLLPVSNADAQLLYQLDCVSMPPLLRQVFDRHIQDFKNNLFKAVLTKFQHWCGQIELSRGYVFEPQRKAAIGHFELILSKDNSQPHQAKLTVHPAYTWLYPKLLTQMARICQKFPSQPLELIAADYQHERQEYLEQLGATRIEQTLLMSRSVWHKLRETKFERLALPEVLQNLQPVPRTPIPSRMSVLKWPFQSQGSSPTQPEVTDLNKDDSRIAPTTPNPPSNNGNPTEPPESGHHA